MTTPGQEDYDREYQWSTFAGEFVEIRFLVPYGSMGEA
jgi:hypothetical protein